MMNKKILLKAVTVLCAAILIAVTVLNVKHIVVSASGGFPNADKYTAGDASINETVKNLDINWISGKVILAYHDENSLTLSETSNKPISSDLQMRWWLDGETLRVQYAKPALFQFSTQNKELTILLPQGLVLNNVEIQTTSADVESQVSESAGNISVSTTSGDINVNAADADNFTASSTSGDISVMAAGIGDFEASSTSGDISVTASNIGDFKASSTSGNIFAEAGEVETINTESTSGNVQLTAAGFKTLEASSTSGEISASLSKTPGFKGLFETVSGDLNFELPLTKQKDAYVFGDGSGVVNISTTSGDIIVK